MCCFIVNCQTNTTCREFEVFTLLFHALLPPKHAEPCFRLRWSSEPETAAVHMLSHDCEQRSLSSSSMHFYP
jgi:hypothetical protein